VRTSTVADKWNCLGRLLFPHCTVIAQPSGAWRKGDNAVVLATAWLLSVPQGTLFQANAQAQSPSPGPSDRTTAIPDQKLDAAAAVLERIASLKKDYEEQMVAAPASDKKRIAAEAFSAFQKAVTDQGLSLDEYISILEVAQNDPEVGDKIRQRLPISPN
jgi:Domain of unknown function (DUF4168)